MSPEQRIEQLEGKVQQAYIVIGVLLAGADRNSPDFESKEGQRALDYFAHEEYDGDFLPFVHPGARR
ncbi:hypothetical protein [Phyllobacterium chamaecytisi]|uniref:hypothetical protein n=1 Tax=Phyllobacterium chamaecytisi TaxID=2876082 RepID=UPI001CCA7310|nr:hypothetical protein [Phyllobacterium sp. KW56]MBZ9600491.1 hypothetical protein [Phyllobacterium sp. KW56]